MQCKEPLLRFPSCQPQEWTHWPVHNWVPGPIGFSSVREIRLDLKKKHCLVPGVREIYESRSLLEHNLILWTLLSTKLTGNSASQMSYTSANHGMVIFTVFELQYLFLMFSELPVFTEYSPPNEFRFDLRVVHGKMDGA